MGFTFSLYTGKEPRHQATLRITNAKVFMNMYPPQFRNGSHVNTTGVIFDL